MIRCRLLAVALSVFAASALYAQGDSTRYINGLPVTEDDTVSGFPANDLGPKTHLQVIAPDKLPARLLKALENGEQYQGWRDTTVYYDANTKLYLVHISKGGSVQIFGMTEKGKPVTFDEVSTSRQ